jgi:CheY-like chemotaxis protein
MEGRRLFDRLVVLVVEDEPLVRALTVDALEDEGFDHLEASIGDLLYKLSREFIIVPYQVALMSASKRVAQLRRKAQKVSTARAAIASKTVGYIRVSSELEFGHF